MTKKSNQRNKYHFHTAYEEVKKQKKENHDDLSSYRIAFTDEDFLLRQELRPVRLQLELLKPEMIMQDERINSTTVIFGSARTKEPSEAQAIVEDIQAKVDLHPKDETLKSDLKTAKEQLKLSRYYTEARALAQLISSECQTVNAANFVVTTGGGPGIMEAANRGAHDVNAKSIGLNITIPHEQAFNDYITPALNFQFHYFAIRKMHFLIRARALIAFPGGFGSLDELFEALTLMQTKKIDVMPIILFGQEFWEKTINFNHLVEVGNIDKSDLDFFQYAETASDAWQIIKDFYGMVDDTGQCL